MSPFDAKTVARRVEALRLARVDSAMEGLYEQADDAAALDAFARGKIDRAEFERRISVQQRAPAKKHRYGR